MNHRCHSIFLKIAILFFLASFFNLHSAQAQRRDIGPAEAPVQVAPVVEKEILAKITVIGTAEADISTTIASQEAGLVKEIRIEEGDWVEKGQLLARLDSAGLEFKLKASHAELREAEIQHEQAERDLARYQTLFAKNIIAEKRFEEIRLYNEELAQKIERLQALTAEFTDRLKKTRVLSPVSGHVVQKNTQVGEWIQEGGAVATIAILNPVKIIVPLPEIYVSRISKGQKVSITFDALPGQTYQGRIAAVVPEADPSARTFPVKIGIDNRKGRIKAGMLARVVFPVGERRRAILVPKDAIVLSDTGNLVYIVTADTAVPVPVKAGLAYDAFVEVMHGLQPGQQVVVRGNERLMPGMKVKVLGTPARKIRP